MRAAGNCFPSLKVIRSVNSYRPAMGGLDIAKLRFASEGWKIRCAIRFFAELGIAYHHVDGNTFTWAVFDGESNLQ